MDSFDQLKQNLIEVLFIVQNLNRGQVIGLSHLVSPASPVTLNDPIKFTPLPTMTLKDMEDLLKQSADPQFKISEHPEVIQFNQLYHLLVLRNMLQQVSLVQLQKFMDITQGRQVHEQLQMFQMLQEIFNSMDVETLNQVHKEFNDIILQSTMNNSSSQNNHQQSINYSSGLDLPHLLGQVISSHLQLPAHLFYLYEPLRVLLQLPLVELEHFQSYFPQWDHTKLSLLVRLMEVGSVNLCDVQDIITLLVPNKLSMDKGAFLGSLKGSYATIDSTTSPPPPSLYLEIAEQPPEKCVYRRNVKPPPSIHLSGDLTINDGYLYIQPLLIRCDSHEEVNHLLDDGGQRVKITSGRTVTFKRLKILSTSHQLNETLFSLKFELRRYSIADSQEKYEILHAVTSIPICVVSHSTQLRANLKSLPVVTEVIPLSGPPSGATRVVVLGSNFIESPTTLVKFDNVEVKPIFHGPKTLICHTPKHPPGTVSVKVCNDLNRWSETEASYTYDGSTQTCEDEPIPVAQQFNINNLLPLFQNSDDPSVASASLDLFTQISNFGTDGHGFSPLHYTAAFGRQEETQVLIDRGANPKQFDKFGNNPLYWAVKNGQINVAKALIKYGGLNQTNQGGNSPLHEAVMSGNLELIQELVSNNAVIDIQNQEGYTPLHLAVILGQSQIVEFLLNSGARADVVTIDGCTPIHLSTLTSTFEILQMIAKQSLHYLFSQDEYGDTVVHWAVRENDESLLRMLVQLGAPFQTFNFDQESPMSLALAINHLSLIPLLTSAVQLSMSDLFPEDSSNPYLSAPLSKCPRLETPDDEQYSWGKTNLKPMRDEDTVQSSYYFWSMPGEDRFTSGNLDLAIG